MEAFIIKFFLCSSRREKPGSLSDFSRDDLSIESCNFSMVLMNT